MDHIESTLSAVERTPRRTDHEDADWEVFNSEALRFLPDLYRIANWLTRNKEDAEDLVQDTLFNAMRSFHLYQPGTNCRAWMTTIMHNLNSRRKQKLGRMKFIDDPDGTIAAAIPFVAPASQSILDKRIRNGLNKIPRYFRDVVILSDVGEYSYKEISSALNVPIGTVMSRLSRGRRSLKRELSEFINN